MTPLPAKWCREGGNTVRFQIRRYALPHVVNFGQNRRRRARVLRCQIFQKLGEFVVANGALFIPIDYRFYSGPRGIVKLDIDGIQLLPHRPESAG